MNPAATAQCPLLRSRGRVWFEYTIHGPGGTFNARDEKEYDELITRLQALYPDSELEIEARVYCRFHMVDFYLREAC